MIQLKDKVAAVFAASGTIGGAVARTLAHHGAKVHVSGRDLKKVQALADDIRRDGGVVVATCVDAMHEPAIDTFLEKIAADDGKLDIVFNAIGLPGEEYGVNTPVTELSFAQFFRGFETLCGSQFLTSRAAARVMIKSGNPGTILTFTGALSRGKFPNTSGYTTACTAIEGLSRALAAEFGAHGIRVICLNATALPETKRIQESFRKYARSAGVSPEDIAAFQAQQNILKKGAGITLARIAETAAYLVSDSGITFNSHIVDADGGKFNVI